MSIFGSDSDARLEKVPTGEPATIANLVELTRKQLTDTYRPPARCLRSVHPKGHGCVEASFTVAENLADEFRAGLFKDGGKAFRCAIRFSNGSGAVGPDGPLGVRGMAVKLYGVEGDRLLPDDRERTQDFLMVTLPVFPFANAKDFEAGQNGQPPGPVTQLILDRLRGKKPPPFQDPPLSPLDATYFSATPYQCGKKRVMKFRARPVNPVIGKLGTEVAEADYLRDALRRRLADPGGREIGFEFQIQLRDSKGLDIEQDIENACNEWDEAAHPFVTVARIAIPRQDISSPQRLEACEKLFFTPWHGIKAHRPLGGINRARREVYEASSRQRGGEPSQGLTSAPPQR